ncbi:hypothetical protein BGX28_010303 [Mortierella sp. GBA30]|nr:hypothetical protein BGX28_010303 [Mortierella sp. GBA30]
MAHTSTQSLPSSPSSPILESTNSCSKSVQFSRFIKISFTYPCDEYDRTALEPAKLTFSEASELMQLRIDWKQDLKRRMQQQQEQQQRLQQLDHEQDSEDGYSSDEARVPGSFSGSSPGPTKVCLFQSLHPSTTRSISSPSSPILSHRSLSLSDSDSTSDEDEYTCEHRGLKSSIRTSGIMHRHNELHQSKENMPCLA